jgi:hypothetical protein
MRLDAEVRPFSILRQGAEWVAYCLLADTALALRSLNLDPSSVQLERLGPTGLDSYRQDPDP